MNIFQKAVAHVGGRSAMGRLCGVTYQAVNRWMQNNALPRSELTGETEYARHIAKAVPWLTRQTLLETTKKSLTQRRIRLTALRLKKKRKKK